MAKSLSLRSLAIALVVMALLCVAFTWQPTRSLINDLDLIGLSWRYRFRGPQAPDVLIRLLGITENTIDAFAKQKVYYPFPRDIQALALKRLADAGARIVVVDILFSEADSWNEEEDEALRGAIEYCRSRGCSVVLAAQVEQVQYSAGATSQSLVTPAPIIMQASPSLGLANTLPKLSYKVSELTRLSLPLGPGGEEISYFSQATEAFRLACGQTGRSFDTELAEAVSGAGGDRTSFIINYNGQPAAFPGYCYQFEVLLPGLFDGEAAREPSAAERDQLRRIFFGSYVFLGSRALADNDYFVTPFGQMFGVDTNAQAFDTLLSRRSLQRVPDFTVIGLAVLLTLLAWSISLHRPIFKSAVAGLAVYLLLVVINWALLVTARVDLSLTMLTQGFALPYIACAIYSGQIEALARRRLRSTFSRYVSDEIVSRIVSDPSQLALGGSERTLAILFNDLRNYSTLTEYLSPAQVVEALNLFLSEASAVVRRNRGFVDKYLGDGFMAFFGGPVATADPAGDALRAALELIRALHERVNPQLRQRGLPEFSAGIGVHYGPVVMGNIGSETRMDFTVIGDAVNVASRVENLTKELGWAVLVTRDVLDSAQAAGPSVNEHFSCEAIGEHFVKGRSQAVVIYRLYDPEVPELFRLGPPPADHD